MRYLSIILIMFFTGCATTSGPIIAGKPDINQESTAGIGDTFFTYLEQRPVDTMQVLFSPVPTPPSGSRFDLTILELTIEKISLQYSEFFQGTRGWMIKDGFNKTFTYSPKETIRFKGYEFEPISITNGQLTYKRVK